jgi:uncharacterized protein (TIGR03067 family)
MRRQLVGVVAVVCSAMIVASGLAAPLGKGGRPELDGEWQATTHEVEGKARPAPETLRIVITGDELSIYLADGKANKSKFKLGGGEAPAAIDLTPDYGVFKGRACAGIYELDKDRLRICVIERDDRGRDPGTRPTAFKTEPRDGLVLLTLKRVK